MPNTKVISPKHWSIPQSTLHTTIAHKKLKKDQLGSAVADVAAIPDFSMNSRSILLLNDSFLINIII